MQMWELVKYDIPREVIEVWEEREGPDLLPVQDRAVRTTGLFDGGNLIVQAPTSAGKTFIGEMAAVRAALARKKVCYLVPLKALAEEKYTDFCRKYSRYGIEVIVSTRDRREFDGLGAPHFPSISFRLRPAGPNLCGPSPDLFRRRLPRDLVALSFRQTSPLTRESTDPDSDQHRADPS